VEADFSNAYGQYDQDTLHDLRLFGEAIGIS
jgi:hypothetical protein